MHSTSCALQTHVLTYCVKVVITPAIVHKSTEPFCEEVHVLPEVQLMMLWSFLLPRNMYKSPPPTEDSLKKDIKQVQNDTIADIALLK